MTENQAKTLKHGDKVFTANCFPGTPILVTQRVFKSTYVNNGKYYCEVLSGGGYPIEHVHLTEQEGIRDICEILRTQIGRLESSLVEWDSKITS